MAVEALWFLLSWYMGWGGLGWADNIHLHGHTYVILLLYSMFSRRCTHTSCWKSWSQALLFTRMSKLEDGSQGRPQTARLKLLVHSKLVAVGTTSKEFVLTFRSKKKTHRQFKSDPECGIFRLNLINLVSDVSGMRWTVAQKKPSAAGAEHKKATAARGAPGWWDY